MFRTCQTNNHASHGPPVGNGTQWRAAKAAHGAHNGLKRNETVNSTLRIVNIRERDNGPRRANSCSITCWKRLHCRMRSNENNGFSSLHVPIMPLSLSFYGRGQCSFILRFNFHYRMFGKSSTTHINIVVLYEVPFFAQEELTPRCSLFVVMKLIALHHQYVTQKPVISVEENQFPLCRRE